MGQAIAAAPAPGSTIDGRSMRAQRTRAAILTATRDFMREGIYRPKVADIAAKAGTSVRSIFQHWVRLRELYLDAVRDAATVTAIADEIRGLPDADAVARAFVLGELPSGKAP